MDKKQNFAKRNTNRKTDLSDNWLDRYYIMLYGHDTDNADALLYIPSLQHTGFLKCCENS